MSSRFFRRSRAVLAALALCGGTAVAVVAATGGTASASQTLPLPPVYLRADSSGLFLDYDATASGNLVIQANFNNHNAQQWVIPAAGATGRIRNELSGECLTTDGTAGDQLYLIPCKARLANYQRWEVTEDAPGTLLTNPYFGLVVDVYNGSTSPGSAIDAWYYTGQSNQWFTQYGGS
jgi:hypothetical protein